MASRQDEPRRPMPSYQRSASVPDPVLRLDAPEQGRRSDESWIEVSSQPSSSSLSSIGDEIITTGLRVGNDSVPHRRRRLYHQQHRHHQHHQQRQHHEQHQNAASIPSQALGAVAGTSSQDEYDETESEEDRVITSSTEHLHPSASRGGQQDADVDADTDEDATALGRAPSPPSFRPQPNAFSHPPAHLTQRRSASGTTSFSPSQPQPIYLRSSHTRPHRSPQPNFMSPAYRADNDAALRASLTTLLSCAAAARGISRKEGDEHSPSVGSGGVLPSPSQPLELRLVPESDLMAEGPAQRVPNQGRGSPTITRKANQADPSNGSNNESSNPKTTRSKSPTPSSTDGPDATAPRTKRAAANRVAKKKQRTSPSSTRLAADDSTTTTTLAATLLSPTVLTWVVSAGVVVLATAAISFRAGFITGRDAGRQEAAYAALHGLAGGSASPNATSVGASCGTDGIRSSGGAGAGAGTLRRFRWGSVGRGVTA